MSNCLYKQKLLEILLEINRVCSENNLSYFLTGGSLLGAIRHKGFIPWDDDIDIAMPRSDYEKLKQIYSKEFRKKFKLVCSEVDKKYYCRYVKIYHEDTTLIEYEHPFYLAGLFVDVFPLDGMPSDKKEREKHYSLYKSAVKKLFHLYIPPQNIFDQKSLRSFFSSIKHTLILNFYYLNSLTNFQKCIEKCEEIAKKYPFEGSEYVANLCGAWGEREIVLRKCFDDFILADFEGYKFRIPKGYHILLSSLYGDYMQLPPIEKRVSHHSHYFLDLNKRWTIDEIKKMQKYERKQSRKLNTNS